MNKKLTNRQRRELIGVVSSNIRHETPPPTQYHRNKYRAAKADVTGRNNKHKGRND